MFTDPAKWAPEALPFGGIQYAPTPWLSLLAEYSPIRYERQTTDPAQPKYFPTAVRSPFNFGARVKPLKWLEIGASWQRGKSRRHRLRRLRHRPPACPDPRPSVPEPVGASRAPLQDRIAFALADDGFSDIAVSTDGFTLRIDAQNDLYFSRPAPSRCSSRDRPVRSAERGVRPGAAEGERYPRGRGGRFGFRALRGGQRIPPHRTDPRRRRFPLRELRRADPPDVAPPLVRLQPRAVVRGVPQRPFRFLQIPRRAGRFAQRFPWRGGTALLGVEGYPVNNISTSNVPLSIPIRSDSADYKREKVPSPACSSTRSSATRDPAYFRVEAGMLETMFGGVDAEAALPLWNGRILAGGSGGFVRKRAPDDPFRFLGSGNYHTALLQGR